MQKNVSTPDPQGETYGSNISSPLPSQNLSYYVGLYVPYKCWNLVKILVPVFESKHNLFARVEQELDWLQLQMM